MSLALVTVTLPLESSQFLLVCRLETLPYVFGTCITNHLNTSYLVPVLDHEVFHPPHPPTASNLLMAMALYPLLHIEIQISPEEKLSAYHTPYHAFLTMQITLRQPGPNIFFLFFILFQIFFFSTNFFIKRSQKNHKRCSDSVLIHLNFANILSFGFVLDIADVCWLFTTVVTHSRPFVI